MSKDREQLVGALASIAQGAINIDEGYTGIEAKSSIHNAMHTICRLLGDDEIGILDNLWEGEQHDPACRCDQCEATR